MGKYVAVGCLTASSREEAADVAGWLPALLAERPWAADATRIVVQAGFPSPEVADGPAVPPVFDAVIELWSDTPLDAALAQDRALADRLELVVLESEEVVAKAPDRPLRPGATPGLSQLSFMAARSGQERAETLRHWSEHIPLARDIHVGMDRYVQDRFLPGGDAEFPWFGMAHLHFPSAEALRDGLFRSPEDVAAITEDVADFVERYVSMLAVELVVKG